MSLFEHVTILPSYKTDQSIIEIEFLINDFHRGKGFWQFNNSLLKDKDYILLVKQVHCNR
jgi:hypothetical protein